MRVLRLAIPCLLALAVACGTKSPPPGSTTPDAGPNPFADYDVSYSAGPFTVQPGTQIVMCTYITAQNTQDEDVQSFLAMQSAGGHHLIVYTVDHPINLPPTPCIQGGQPSWQQILGTQDESQEVILPTGVGFHLKANQQLVMETHYINGTPNVLTVHSAFGLKYSPPGTVTQQAHPYFFGSLNINIPPNASWSTQSTCSPPDPVTFYYVQGHEHQMGTGVTVNLIPGDGGPAGGDGGGYQLYETQQWSAPPIATFNDGLGLTLGTSDQLQVTCDWTNTGDTALSYPLEMCYAVGIYWPGPGALFCALGGGDNTDCQCGYEGTIDTGPGGSTVTVNVGLQDGLTGTKGDPPSSGHPIYCFLYQASDWPATSEQPNPGAQYYYMGDVQGVALTNSSVLAQVNFVDVTPGDYSAFCFEDTISGGFFPGSGDPLAFPLGSVTAVAGTTATADVYLNVAIP